MRRFAVLSLLLPAALIGAGCGDEDASGSGSTSTSVAAKPKRTVPAKKPKPPATPQGTRVKVVDSDYGRVIADGKGEALYLFDKESSRKARCYGSCASVWPPVLTKGEPAAGQGAKQAMLGTTRRADGKLQVTYAGHPLYYYVSDSPGTILCHDVAEFGGLWLVVKPNGHPAGS